MRKRATNQTKAVAAWGPESTVGIPQIRRSTALKLVGEVVYAARVGELIKIGHTSDLQRRLNHLGGELLGFRAGTRDDEAALHADLNGHQHHGREWYYPTRDVLAVVNEMRTPLGLQPIAA